MQVSWAVGALPGNYSQNERNSERRKVDGLTVLRLASRAIREGINIRLPVIGTGLSPDIMGISVRMPGTA
jgi:hypothetical protein